MNTIATTSTPAVEKSTVNPALNNMKWLLRREFWENKGGIFWAPVFTGAIFLGLMIMAILVGQMSVNRAHIKIANLNLNELVGKITPEIREHLYAGTEISLYMIAGLLGVVLFFVLFFYCLGALYDDRRDRSVLFWKSLPLSDRATVGSKALTALVVAPVISSTAAIVTGIGFLTLLSIYVGLHGINPFPLLWAKVAPAKVAFNLFATLPVQMLWALPTVGWLLLCSAWARSKPFLWAVAVPIGAGIMVSWFDLMKSFAIPDAWFWKNVVARLLLSIVPGTWLDSSRIGEDIQGPQDLLHLLDVSSAYSTLATAELWVGAIAGLAMIAAAVYFRRKRDEG
jgi:ABC-2 type transport system permease protein